MSGLASFAAGFGGGYLNAKRQEKIDAERAEDRAISLANADYTQRQRAKADALDVSLANAVRPASVAEGAGGALKSDSMDNRDVGLAENAELPNQGLSLAAFKGAGQSFDTKAAAQNAVDAYNKPDAQLARQSEAYSANSKPLEALSLSNAVFTQKQHQTKLEQDQAAHVKKLKDEGAVQAWQALGRNDPAGIKAGFNQSGQYKIDGEIKMLQEDREMPWGGKQSTNTASFNIIGPDGKVKPITVNYHDMAMGLMPYKDQLDLGIKGRDSATKQDKAAGDIANATERNRLSGEATVARIEASAAKASAAAATSEGKPMTEGQSKALLFGSRMREADKILIQLASEGTTTSIPGSRAPGVGSLITSMSSANKQMLDQGKRDFMSAVLRRESGAAISDGEYENADRQYFPQVGDSPQVKEQKSRNRQLAISGVLVEVPERYRNSVQPAPRAEKATVAPMPKEKSGLQAGSVYQTSRGPAKWNGSTFEAQ